jgi:hypothetical protein
MFSVLISTSKASNNTCAAIDPHPKSRRDVTLDQDSGEATEFAHSWDSEKCGTEKEGKKKYSPTTTFTEVAEMGQLVAVPEKQIN